MKIWRLTRAPFVALDGAGALRSGGRYSSPGRAVVYAASEAALAVLIALRYWPGDGPGQPDDYQLGWTILPATPPRVPPMGDEPTKKWVDAWLADGGSVAVAVASRVLPEADVVLINPAHADAARILPLATRPFAFAQCLHRPPMLDAYRNDLA
ncbi:MAG: RES family NAD+ phosphorylase [Sphingopyxis sp.]